LLISRKIWGREEHLTFKPLPDYGLTPEDFDKSFINVAEWESRAFGYYDKNIG